MLHSEHVCPVFGCFGVSAGCTSDNLQQLKPKTSNVLSC